MFSRIVLPCLWNVLFFMAAICYSTSALADSQPIIDKLNNLSDSERTRTLLQQSKKEASIHWYTDMQSRNLQDVLKLWGERHPQLKVEAVRLGHERLINRVMTEYRAGKFTADVLTASSAFVKELREADIISRNPAPFRSVLREGTMDPDGWINSVSTTFYAIFYNTDLVKPADLPKSYQDFLHPRWKGKIAIDQEDVEWLAALIEIMGREDAIEFAKQLAANKPNLRRGHTLLGQLVGAGESAIFPDQYLHSGINLKKAGAPVEMYFIEPVLTQTSDAVWITRKAAHPHASLLFIDFLFSKEVQTKLAEFGRLASRRDVSLLYGLEAKKIHFLSRQWKGEKYKELNELFRDIFAR